MDYEKAYKEALERARKIKDGKDEWRYSDLAEITPALTEIFPELRESEDERIRKEIISIVKEYGRICEKEGDPCSTLGDCLAYLEKQKINTEGDFGRGYDCGYQAGYAVAMNEMKQKVATATLDSEKQKEQKPELVQHPTITYTYNSNASRDERLKAALLALLNSDLLKVKEGGYFTKQDLIEWVERIPTDKPAEGSEEDERIRKELCSYLLKQLGRQKDNLIDAKFDEWITWLEKQKEQKPVARENDFVSKEWSEEDEEMMTDIIESLEYAYPNDNEFRIAWLKSLRPIKQEWSKEDESFLDSIEDAISSYYDLNHAPQYHYWLEEKLKSLRPSWKPSEHQMKILKAVKEYVGRGSGYWGEGLGSLIEDLEKL